MGVLIGLGADLDAADGNGQTPLEFAMMRGDLAAIHTLTAAGARPPRTTSSPDPGDHHRARRLDPGRPSGVRCARRRRDPQVVSGIGFTEVRRYPEDGPVTFWGHVTLGKAELTFDMRVPSPHGGATLLVTTNRVHDLYEQLRSPQLNVVFIESCTSPMVRACSSAFASATVTLCFLQPSV